MGTSFSQWRAGAQPSPDAFNAVMSYKRKKIKRVLEEVKVKSSIITKLTGTLSRL